MSPADGMRPGAGFEGGWLKEGLADDARLECGVCWHVYDPAVGDRSRGVEPGTRFLALPDDWRCPECDAAKETFMVIDAGRGPKRGADAQTMQSRLELLLAAYRDADLAMAGLPIYNAALRIAAFGFREHDGAYAGALVTPWFLNLVLLPKQKASDARASGSTRSVAFPSGAYAFSSVRLDRVGAFEFCSLFSPMLEFEDQEAARLAATAAIEGLFEAPPEKPKPEPVETSRRTLLLGRRRTPGGAHAP
jgi:[NiFe] hydrogenase assembly HybE family chaperone